MSRDLLSAVDKVSVEVKPASPKTNANVLLEVFREGKLITRREKHNLVVNSGKADMAARLLVTPSTLYQFMRLGYNGVTASSAQTQITTVIASSQMACGITCRPSGWWPGWRRRWRPGIWMASPRDWRLLNLGRSMPG